MSTKSFKELVVWQLSMDLVVNVYRCVTTFPPNEKFGLASQLQRAAVSIPSNIAEGNATGYRQAYLRHLAIARGSLAETETQLLIALRLGYVSEQSADELYGVMERVGKMLSRRMVAVKRQDKWAEFPVPSSPLESPCNLSPMP